MEDSTLIRKFRQDGDREAARELLEKYERPLFNFLWQMLRHTQDSEDALQETFGKALRSLPNYREESHFKSWLYRIGHNEALNVIRRRKRLIYDPSPDSLQPAPVISEELNGADALDAKERSDSLNDAIAGLPDVEREVVVLRLQSNLPFKEIAEITASPLGTVLARMHNAKKRLKEALTPALLNEP